MTVTGQVSATTGLATPSGWVVQGGTGASDNTFADTVTVTGQVSATTGLATSAGWLVQGGTGASDNTMADSLEVTGRVSATTGFYTANGHLDQNGTSGTVNNTMADSLEVTGDVSGTTIGGITEANLLDKTATESITGEWTFDNLIADSLNVDSLVVGWIDVASGEIDGTVIGANSAAAGNFTTLGITQGITHAPTITGNLYDLQLETEWTTGVIMIGNYGSNTTLSGDVAGIYFDFESNVTSVNRGIDGFTFKIPAQANTGTDPLVTNGFTVSGGAFTHDATAGTALWKGLNVSLPDITQGAGSTVNTYGVYIDGGTVTSGTEYGLYLNSTDAYIDGATAITGELSLSTNLLMVTGSTINWNSTDIFTHSANTMTLSGYTTWDFGAAVTIDFNSAPTFTAANGLFLFTSTAGLQSNILGSGTAPVAGQALAMATGGVLGWNSADYMTHSANTMTLSGFTTWDMGAVTSVGFDGITTMDVGGVTFTIDITGGTGTAYAEIIDDSLAGFLALGRTTNATGVGSRLSIVDGGADNGAGELVLYDDGGTGHYLWVNTADVLRGHNTAPADDDAAGYAIMDLSDGTIGATGQAGTFSTLDAAGAFTSPGIDDNADAIAITIDVTTEEVNLTGLLDGNGAISGTNNTLADTLEITGAIEATSLVLANYTKDISIPVGHAALGPTAPDNELCGTYACLGFDADAETIGLTYEVPSDYVSGIDMFLRIYWTNQAGDAIQNGETVEWEGTYRIRDWDNEIYDGSNATAMQVVYTEAGTPGTDKDTHISSITLADDDGDNPIVAGQMIGIILNRDVTNDTYTGEPRITLFELRYTSNGIGDHQ